MIRNVAMKNDVEDQFGPLYEKCGLLPEDEEENDVHILQKEGRLTGLVKSCVGTVF